MINVVKKTVWLSLLLCTFCLPSYASQKLSLLNHLKSKISIIKKAIAHERGYRTILQNELAQTETMSGQVTVKLQQTQQKLQQTQRTLQTLTVQQNQAQQQLDSEQKILSGQLRTAYMMGRQSYFQLMLNQQNIDQLNRMLTYYKYLMKSRLQTIQRIETLLATINHNREHIQNQYQALEQLGQKIQEQRNQLTHSRQYRQELIQKISQQITSKQQNLDELLKNQQQLTHTVNHLEKTEISNLGYGHFNALKGQLIWPTHGKVLHTFDTIINQSELRWGGDLIEAQTGQPVYAVAAGKVIFAKWLAGYGLLLIVYHGNGYMTLYGRNHTLYKQVGDTVKAGQLIATVGNTGGYDRPALYFAIRYNGKPLDPQRWCR